MAKLPVVFKYGTRAEYDALETKSSEALYFLTDTGEIYRGTVNLARGNHYEGVRGSKEVDGVQVPETDNEVIARILGTTPAVKDDIFVIKTLIGGEAYSYISLIYDGEHWKAMDGNYNAENVYFSDDFTVTNNIGAFVLPEGESNTKLQAAGKNLKELLASLLAAKVLPEVTDPAVTVKFTNSVKALEVGAKVTPTYSASLSAGEYTYGPATGIVANGWKVEDTKGNVKDTATGSFPEITVEAGMTYGVTASATYDAGAVPVDNLGNAAAEKQIPAVTEFGKVTGSASTKITGYRNSFYGTYAAKEVDGVQTGSTSDSIRTLTASGKTLANGSTFDITIPADAQRVVIAYPATLKNLEYVKDANDSDANIISAFTDADGNAKATIQVFGMNGHDPIDYKVFSTDFAGAYGTTNTFKVKILK